MTSFRSRLFADGCFRTCLTIGMVMLATGCGKKEPEGQVVAVVNGQEITRRDLAAEPQSGGMFDSSAGQPVVSAVLSGVIDRKLAAAEAKQLKLDQTPQFVEQAKRLEEALLGRALFERWAAEVPAPNAQAIAAFVSANPQRFDHRRLFLVDRIEAELDEGQSDALVPLMSNDAIAAYLDAHSKTYTRTRTAIDSATLPLPLYKKVIALKPGEPLAQMQGGKVAVIAVVDSRDAPLSDTERSDEAVKAMKQAVVQQRLAALRKSAEVAYQAGYRPVTQKGEATSKKDHATPAD